MTSQWPGNGSESAADASTRPAGGTLLPDLSETPLDDLRTLDNDLLETAAQRVLSQVVKPRTNLGASGPPGRTD